MEERLKKALEFSSYRQTLNNQLHNAKVKAEGMLIYAESGGKFTINQQLICFVDYLDRSGYKDAVILDDNKSPIQIADIAEFLNKIRSKYFEVTNDYLREAMDIKKKRNSKSILEIEI